ncbi:MAG TPA: amidohydrolase family protein [Caldimonas sp.]|jgi:D-galactarolactone isomerase|nr:amidohydrolase family protein [Caldimonas sp.]HEV7576636.1 amidohydrolase family protein [Caldimonas sp.]
MTVTRSPWPGACDCHMHVYEDVWPLAPTATFKPPHAPASAYRDVQRELRLERTVVVQPTGYAFDNRCTLAAVAALGADARAIVVVPPDVAPAELESLHEAGARGVRYMMLPGGVLPWSGLEAAAAAIAPLGWHIDLQLDGRALPQHEATLRRLPCRLVIDHVGRFMGPVAPDSDAVAALCRLLDSGTCWIKISAPYESSRSGAPGYDDIAWIARLVAGRYPERCLWASNWPHPNQKPAPSNAAMLDWGLACIADAATQRKALVDNPAELYGFAPVAAT